MAIIHIVTKQKCEKPWERLEECVVGRFRPHPPWEERKAAPDAMHVLRLQNPFSHGGRALAVSMLPAPAIPPTPAVQHL